MNNDAMFAGIAAMDDAARTAMMVQIRAITKRDKCAKKRFPHTQQRFVAPNVEIPAGVPTESGTEISFRLRRETDITTLQFWHSECAVPDASSIAGIIDWQKIRPIQRAIVAR